MHHVGICGIRGKMAQAIVEALAPIEPTAGYTRACTDRDPSYYTNNFATLLKGSDVIIDVSQPEATQHLCAHAQEFLKPLVIGTTNLSPDTWNNIHHLATRVPVVYAANFSVGVTIVNAAAGWLAKHLPQYDIDLIDLHHAHKKDAPSGTAKHLATTMARTRGWHKDSIMTGLPEGPRPNNIIHVNSHRSGSTPGTHTIHFTNAHEQITLGHQAFNRQGFAQGALLAAEWVVDQLPGLYGMADVIGLMPEKTSQASN